MRPLSALYKASGSSARWLTRQKNDPYVKQRSSSIPGSQTNYRSRSSFKLVSLAEKHKSLLRPGDTVVDLGAAPGGWTQVAVNALKGRGKVFAVDLLEMQAIEGAVCLKGDFLSAQLRRRLLEEINPDQTSSNGSGIVDTVLSDMMASMSGVRDRDIQASLDLVQAATTFAKGVLTSASPSPMAEMESVGGKIHFTGGNLVMKFFQHPDLIAFKAQELDPYFCKVSTEKPKESRSESSEAYWVCLGYKGDS